MRKRAILWLVLTAIVLTIIGAAVFVPTVATAASHCTQQQLNTNTCTVNLSGGQAAGVAVGSILWVIAALIWIVAWIGALVRSARMGSWAWFIVVLIFSGLGTLIYALFGPADRPAATYPYTGYPPAGYPPGYQPGGYPPTYQPGGYPPSGYPPYDYPPASYPPSGYPPGAPPPYPQS